MKGNPFDGNKLLRFPEYIADWMRTGRTRGPIEMDLDITNKCPHRCPRCVGQWTEDAAAFWPLEEVSDMVCQFAAMGGKAVSFGGGGDPLAHPNVIEIAEATNAAGLSVGVITNGAILKSGWAERLTAICKWIRFSLDAATPETFARVHGVAPEMFWRVLANITQVALVKGDCALGIGFLTDKKSAVEIVEAARVAREVGVDYIQYRPYNYDGYNPTDEILDAKQYEADGFSVLASWPKYAIIDENQKPYKQCHWPHFGAVVTATKELHVCCEYRGKEGFIGRLESHTLAELWGSEAHKAAIAAIDLSQCPPLCRGNVHNLILDKIAEPITHEEFL